MSPPHSAPRARRREPSQLALATAQLRVCFFLILHHTSSVTPRKSSTHYSVMRLTRHRSRRHGLTEAVCALYTVYSSPRARVVERRYESNLALYSLERRLRYSLERRLASSLSVSPTKALMPSAILVVAHTSALSASRKSASEIFPSPG